MKLLPLLVSFATVPTVQGALLSVGPDYHRPALPAAPAYRDVSPAASPSVSANPVDATPSSRPPWWVALGDPTLNALEQAALTSNQSLTAATARLVQARADAGLARSAYFPTLAADGSLTRDRYSATVPNGFPQKDATVHQVSVDAAWELDLFGRVRRLNEGARESALASAADLAAVRLALAAEVATTYVALRATDRERAIVSGGTELRRHELKLISAKRRNGAAADFDVSRAETELATTEAEAAALLVRRKSLQDALAVLAGEPAPTFVVDPQPGELPAPSAVPAGLPSDLLERRPDVIAAEHGLAAANARIGVAQAAFFPAISLTGSAGYASGEMHSLFTADSRQWGFGPNLYLPLFQGGRNRANLERSRAAYAEAVADYREKVLVAFREVQDALSASRYLGEQAAAQARELTAARRSNALAQDRYQAGFVSYFEVIDAQRVVLASERATVQLAAQRLSTQIALIIALGGGWQAAHPE